MTDSVARRSGLEVQTHMIVKATGNMTLLRLSSERRRHQKARPWKMTQH